MRRGPALRCALLQLPSQRGADFLRHHVHGVGPGQPGTARHGSASGQPRSASSCNHSKGQGGQGQGAPPKLPAPARMEPAKLPLTKRMAPAPPIPAKTKPVPVLATKPSDPQPSTSADMEWGRARDPDANSFNMVSVTTARLSHPTATRPRVPGQRPPSLALGSTGGPHGGEQPQGLPRSALCAPVPSTGQAPVPPWSTEGLEVLEGRPLALEDLKAEVRTLHILVDLMRVQHLRDLQELRQELCQEQAQRQVLQAEVERVRKGLPC
ncbi:SH3 domain-containing kinase-binding protein 1-like isoform X2 [Serinus canaria]|uniref:SH3 domain-containing kinase-binding protein 1-like isoform X2 n=1 Tax=Serinus canaria TaxID=9135 RepID=UPI0021CCF844|nr:SH3 domain-containing kinase-binding protein 1-like isoform X2 [Serinus canaria]